jgi:hypothetical protein
MPDYTIGIAERIASLPDSFATSNSVNRNYFQETNQSVINKVTVALAPDTPTALDPNPDTEFASSTDGDSVDTYGQQDGPLFITLLATIEEAGELSQYLLRADPAFWFSNLAISLNTLSEANKNIVANLEIGQQIAVTKTFPAGVVPQSVTEYLFVEGISHRVTPETHVVTIYTGPATTYLQWLLGNYSITSTRTNLAPNPNFEVNTTGWSSLGSSVLTRVDTSAYVGSYSMLVTDTTTGFAGAFLTFTPSSGTTYTASCYVKNTAGLSRSMFVRIVWSGSSESTGTVVTVPVGSNWTRISVTATAPNSGSATLYFVTSDSGSVETSELALIDAVLLEVASSVLPYFDGTYDDPYTGYTLTFQAWNGTANTSTSTTVWGLNSSGTGSALGDSTYGLA